MVDDGKEIVTGGGRIGGPKGGLTIFTENNEFDKSVNEMIELPQQSKQSEMSIKNEAIKDFIKKHKNDPINVQLKQSPTSMANSVCIRIKEEHSRMFQ